MKRNSNGPIDYFVLTTPKMRKVSGGKEGGKGRRKGSSNRGSIGVRGRAVGTGDKGRQDKGG